MKKIVGLMIACFVFCVSINAQVEVASKKSCAKSCSKMCAKDMQACADKMGMTLEECKKMCADKGLTSADVKAITKEAVSIVGVPTCCLTSLKADGKVCCKAYEASFVNADKVLDIEGNEIMSASAEAEEGTTRVGSVVMVMETNPTPAKGTKKACSKSCKKTCSKGKAGA